MRKILLVALTAAAMVSCSENEGFENESTMNRIKFGDSGEDRNKDIGCHY